MTIIYGTENNDTIDATYSNGTSWGDSVKAGGGNDTVKLGPGVSYFSGPGNDTITADYNGSYAGSIVVYDDPSPSIIDLANGKMYDAYGGIDTVSDITEVHFGTVGGNLYGSSLNEVVFIWGGSAKLYLGSGQDTVRVWEQQSNTYTVETAGASTFLLEITKLLKYVALKVLNLPIKPSLEISEKMPKILSLNFSIKLILGRKLKLRKDGGTQVSTTNHNL